MSGIWVSPSEYVAFGEAVDRRALGREVATREMAWDWTGMVGLLPDPDPVLRQLPDAGVHVLEALTADGHVMSQVQTRKLGTLRREWRWTPGTAPDADPTPQAQAVTEALTADLSEVDLYGVVSQILDAPLYGMTPVELLWAPGDGRLRLVDLVPRPTRWFGFDEHNRPRFVSRDNPWDGQELPWGKFVFARHFPTYDNPYGLRLLSRCFWPVTFKRGGMKFWVTLAEKYGMPFLVGRYGPTATPAQQDALLAALSRMFQDAVAVVPEGSRVEILEVAAKGASSDVHERLVSAMDAEVSKVLVGQTLSAEVGDRGSYAAAKAHLDVLEDIRDADQRLVQTTLEEVARIFTAVNAPGAEPPRLRWYEEEDPQEAFARRDRELAAGGVRYRKAYYMRRYGLAEDEFEVAGALEPDGGDAPSAAAFAEDERAEPVDMADAQARRMETEADPVWTGWIDEVRALAEQVDSLEELAERLLDLHPKLAADDLAEVMGRALAAAELAGRYDAAAEVGGA